MKKLIALSVLAVSIGSAAVSAEAKSTDSSKSSAVSTAVELNAAQTRRVIRVRPNGRVVRTVTRTRVVRVGFRRYRETVQYRYLPNGRVTTRVISRVQIR